MKNVLTKRVALQRAIGFTEDYLEKVREEFGRPSTAYRSLKADLHELHELLRELQEMWEEQRR